MREKENRIYDSAKFGVLEPLNISLASVLEFKREHCTCFFNTCKPQENETGLHWGPCGGLRQS